ncbi:MAG: hypothetical protein ACXVJD_11250 [Mucilaginibacter sp.]
MHSIETIKQHAGNKVCPEHHVRPAINVFNQYTNLLFCCNTFRDQFKKELTEKLGEDYLNKNARFY